MNDTKDQKKTVSNAMKTFIGGAITGAAVGATTVLLADKKNREKLKGAAEKAKNTLDRKAEKAGRRLENMTEEGKEALDRKLADMGEVISEARQEVKKSGKSE